MRNQRLAAGTSAGDCATVTKPTRPSSLTTARTPSRTESRRPLPARSRKVSVTAETVSKLLRLGHGASSSRDVQDTAWTRGRRDPKPDAVVVVGVLRFDSVREGALAVSGFFLDDETGEFVSPTMMAPVLSMWDDVAVYVPAVTVLAVAYLCACVDSARKLVQRWLEAKPTALRREPLDIFTSSLMSP